MRNSIRPYRLASLRSSGEAQTLPAGGEADGAAGLEPAPAKAGVLKRPWERVGGWRRRARKADYVKQGDLHGCKRAEEAAGPHPRAGVRALIVAMKPGNAGGAKGCRKMETRCCAIGRDRR